MESQRHRELQANAVDAEANAFHCLMSGDRAQASRLLGEAERWYRESWEAAPPGGYGRLIGMMKAAIVAGDPGQASRYVRSVLSGDEPSPSAAYAIALASLAARDDAAAESAAGRMTGDDAFRRAAAAIIALARNDAAGYAAAIRAIVVDFEHRQAHLTGVAIADTAVVLEALAEMRGLAQRPASPVLPAPSA